MNDYFVYTDKMTVGYDGKPLIRDIEIRLKRGQILTLIGPNGAGKSTILKSITKQLSLIGGAVYLDRELMHHMSGKEVAKKLAVVMTGRMHTELMTCEDIVSTGRYPYTGRLGILSDTDRQKVYSAMELVHALELKDKDFTAISDGQRQRVLLARAICQEPEVIVLDEPTSFLDIRHKLELLGILKNMVLEKNLAVIMSLHELDLAQKISDIVVCVHGDTIERFGTPEEIFTNEYIHTLYGMTSGSYNADFGCLEMARPQGEPQIFVIGGNGRGIPVYRKLQRQGIPFAAGVLHENDVDYAVAKFLACRVITEQSFEPIGEDALQEAKKVLAQCQKVVCCVKTFAAMNKKNEELLEEAQKRGLEVFFT
ncbi:MAG: ABC transporter ATP-binding protein [Lachnospiraceae bacterium]|uniref:ABC transporter ATP-binding protein n=1 Tax=Parablautia sp. Marseille-Q6255 TaxID=3039593 RepID=UPI0024BC0254|nr:ABC transporter ATP-binding protein [Parablautia sp. Marseille-Q6255]